MSHPLAGINILVTRPAHQADELACGIRRAGGEPVLFPVLEILDTTRQESLLNLIGRLDEFDLAIFISPNAADKALEQIRGKRTFPTRLKVAAVGQATARQLAHYGIDEVIAPATRFDSEALLELEELKQVEGKRIVIFRGDGGRELLGENLVKRGAALEYAECYRRVKPEADITPLQRVGARGEIHGVTMTSSEGLRNLCQMIGEDGQAWLKNTPLFVSHERIAHTAGKLGFTHVILAAAGDNGLLEGLLKHFRAVSTQP
ncbi:MAG: uroporphyrinogen-III synthase [Nitrosospira sp.]|nr:uroporphyrinogen-III synthase [Nitrosospira sp.]